MTLDEIVAKTGPKHIKVSYSNSWFEVTIGEDTGSVTKQAMTFERALDLAFRGWVEIHRV